MNNPSRRKFLKITSAVAGIAVTNYVLSGGNAVSAAISPFKNFAPFAPKNIMRCEFIQSPIGIDDLQPALSWTVADNRRGAMQSSYRILVASSSENLAANKGDLWDSGDIESQDCNQVNYKGKTLASRQQCYWKVFIKSSADKEEITGWSAPGMWEMGLLQPSDWQAKWIQSSACKPVQSDLTELWSKMTLIPHRFNGFKNDPELAAAAYKKGQQMVGKIYPAPVFKTSFNISDKIKKARLYISGLGFQDAVINNKPVSDRIHDPSVTHYAKRAAYATHDITSLLKIGDNVISATVGSGWFHEVLVWGSPEKAFGDPSLMAQLEIELVNGKKIIIGSDNNWQTAVGPIVKSDYYAGEAYDARRADINNNDLGWINAQEAQPKVGKLTAQKCEPERVVKKVKPVAITEPKPGVYVIDLGELIVGTFEMNLKAPTGTTLTMRTAEVVWGMKNQGKNFKADLLHYNDFENSKWTDGMIASKGRGGAYFTYSFTVPGSKTNLGSFHLGCPTMVYIAKGGNETEYYRPSFTIHAFRYLEIIGLKSKPNLDQLTGLVITNDSDPIGSFECGHQPFNDIWEASINSTRYNTHGMTWDNCVERLQSQVYNAWSAPFISYILLSPNLWKKILEDQRLMNSLEPKQERFAGTIYGNRMGAIPAIYPVTQGVTVELPMELYTRYGDLKELERHYPHMKAWCEAFFPSKDGVIIPNATMAAWNDHFYVETSEDCEWRPELNQPAFMSIMMYKNIMDTAKVARILNKTSQAEELESLGEKVKLVVNTNWYNAANKTYGSAKNKKTQQIDDSTGWHGMMVLAIVNGVAPKEDIPDMVNNCIKDMKEKYREHHAAGHITHQLVYDVFSDYGLIETCYNMMNATSFPSFRWILAQSDSKTISEGPTNVDQLPSKTTVAQNECQEPARWFTQTLCGISPDFDQPAFKHVLLNPKFPAKLPSASLKTTTAYGELESSWVQKNQKINWKVIIPANSYATVSLPVNASKIKEGKLSLDKVKGCKIIKKELEQVKFELAAGEYVFSFSSPKNKPALLNP